MLIETEIEVKFRKILGDSFPDDISELEWEELIAEHIMDFCREHGIERRNVRIIDGDDVK